MKKLTTGSSIDPLAIDSLNRNLEQLHIDDCLWVSYTEAEEGRSFSSFFSLIDHMPEKKYWFSQHCSNDYYDILRVSKIVFGEYKKHVFWGYHELTTEPQLIVQSARFHKKEFYTFNLSVEGSNTYCFDPFGQAGTFGKDAGIFPLKSICLAEKYIVKEFIDERNRHEAEVEEFQRRQREHAQAIAEKNKLIEEQKRTAVSEFTLDDIWMS